MNDIQKFLMEYARVAIGTGAVELLKDRELNPVKVAASLHELLDHLEKSESKLESKITFDGTGIGLYIKKDRIGEDGKTPVFLNSSK